MAFKRTRLYQAFRQRRLHADITHAWHLLRDSEYRAGNQAARLDFRRFYREHGGDGLRAGLLARHGQAKTALILSQSYLPFAKVEALVLKAFQLAGFRTVVLGNRRYDFLRYTWLSGTKTVLEFEDFAADGADDVPDWVDGQMRRLSTVTDWLALTFNGVHVGRFVVASVLRGLKVGRLDFADAVTRTMLRSYLERSVRHAVAAGNALTTIEPDVVLMMDRGYMGYGEVFDAAIQRNIDTLTWNLGYKSSRLVFKRYHSRNQREHPLCPSSESWAALQDMPWNPEHTQRLRKELFDCYNTQDWFSVVGTQFDKQILSHDTTRQKLGIATGRKVAVIFPHILWDGSFFYGEDLFQDYTEWFVETLRAAIGNDRLEWLVKLHPAHVVKARQHHDSGRPSEMQVIEREFGTLPPHVKLVHPDTDISTYSLFEVADCTVTVRGTVGIESALFGVPVITAGSGRYDRRGFTIDSATREEYLRKLATLETFSRLSDDQVRLAERYAYGLFFWRPLSLSSASLEYARDEKATPRLSVHCRSREQWRAAADMRRLADWIADGRAEDMPGSVS